MTAPTIEVPRPQLPASAGFKALPIQLKLLDSMRSGRHIIGFGGAIRGTKTFGCLAALITLCLAFPRSRWAIVRKDLPTLRRNTVPSFNKLRPYFGGFVGAINQSTWTAPCTNGSELIFFPESVDTDPELNRWKGLEVNGFLLEECDELQERSYHKAIERAGAWIIPDGAPMPPRYVLCTFNPNPFWPKVVFYDPWANGSLATPYDFIPAGPKDNPYVDAGQWAAWQQMPALEYKRFILMDWSVLTGRFYDSLNGRVHMIDREQLPAHIPDWWEAWGSFDWGYAHWAVFCLFVKDEDGTIYCLAALWMRRRQDKAMGEAIVDFVKQHKLERALYDVYAGRDTFHKQRAHAASGQSCADIFALAGISCVAADDDRVNSARAVRRALAVTGAGTEDSPHRSGVYLVKSGEGEDRGTARIYDQLAGTLPDPDYINEPLKVDADDEGRGGDDGENSFRFGLASRVPAARLPVATRETPREWETDKDNTVFPGPHEQPPESFVGGFPIDIV